MSEMPGPHKAALVIDSLPKKVPSVVGAQLLDDWPELEVVQPLKQNTLPRPVEVHNDLLLERKAPKPPRSAGSVAAGGDAPEVRPFEALLFFLIRLITASRTTVPSM